LGFLGSYFGPPSYIHKATGAAREAAPVAQPVRGSCRLFDCPEKSYRKSQGMSNEVTDVHVCKRRVLDDVKADVPGDPGDFLRGNALDYDVGGGSPLVLAHLGASDVPVVLGASAPGVDAHGAVEVVPDSLELL